MSALDLTEAVEAAARALDVRAFDPDAPVCVTFGQTIEDARRERRVEAREEALAVLTAAAPIVERQVREMVAAEQHGPERIDGTWLVEDVSECTCAGVDQFGHAAHERGCGSVPLVDLRGLKGWDSLVGFIRAQVAAEIEAAEVKAGRARPKRCNEADEGYCHIDGRRSGLIIAARIARGES